MSPLSPKKSKKTSHQLARPIFTGLILAMMLGSMAYAATGFRLISLGGMNFASFFDDGGASVGVEATSFHAKGNDTYLSSPVDGTNRISGTTYLSGNTYFGTVGSNTGVIGANGNVGIGTTSPGAPLEVNGHISVANADPYVRTNTTNKYLVLAGGNGWLGGANIVLRGSTAATNPYGMEFFSSGSERMKITANGNVGIGAYTPTTKLDIYDNGAIPMLRVATATHALYAGAGTGTTVPWIGSSTNSDFALVSNSIARMFIGSGGNIGIGTSTPTATLTVSGVIAGLNRFGISYPTTGVYDDVTIQSPYSRVDSDSFHTNGLGVGQTYIEGAAIDANTTISIGKGLAGGQVPNAVSIGTGGALSIDTAGNVSVTNTPTSAAHVATKAYVDAAAGSEYDGMQWVDTATNSTHHFYRGGNPYFCKSKVIIADIGYRTIRALNSGSQCDSGKTCAHADCVPNTQQIYVGPYNGYTYYTTPSQCNDSPTPTCAGAGNDTLTKIWSASAIVTGQTSLTNGAANTAYLAANYADTYAAKYCQDMVFGGYSDWFLPASRELELLYAYMTPNIGGGSTGYYHSSSEVTATTDRVQVLPEGTTSYSTKVSWHFVRCMRKQ